MLFGEYAFEAVLEDEALLPPYKGSTFRGVFGRALKAVVCALKRQECADCLLGRQCLYTRIFETPPDYRQPGRPTPPHPFVIEPPDTTKTHFLPGEAFNFTLLLFGPANQYLPYFVYAFEEMGKIGIGRQIEGRRARFVLQSVRSAGQAIYDAVHRTLSPAEAVELSLERPPPAKAVTFLTVRLLTPLRLKYQNRLQADLPFHVLLRAALRRLSALNSWFGAGEPPLDYKGLTARAQEVKVRSAALRWYDWQRYSHRQDQAMLMGGLVGEVTYAGDLSEFIPVLRYAEKVHLGKATTFGLGKIRLEARG